MPGLVPGLHVFGVGYQNPPAVKFSRWTTS